MLAATTALAAAVLAVLALRPSSKTAVTLAARNPAVEVRTVVIRRTIHIVKHEHAPSATGATGGVAAFSGTSTVPRTSTSGSRASGSAAVAAGTVSTRTSGSHSSAAIAGSAPVTTRTSAARGGSTGGSGSAGPVTTRTSAPSGSSTGGASGQPVSTRTSGIHGGDGGDGSGGGDN
jgi:hypothetical protein